MKQIFASADYGLVGLIFFCIFFAVVAFWTYRPSAKNIYKSYGDIPLKDNKK